MPEYYEIPKLSSEYAGSGEETINIFKFPTWDNTRTIDYFETNVKYNTGRFRGVRLLKVNDSVGATWKDKSIIDNVEAEVSNTIIQKIPSIPNKNGTPYKDVVQVMRKVVTNKNSSPVTSTQYLFFAKGIGLVGLQNIDRRHVMSDFVRPNRMLASYKFNNAKGKNGSNNEGLIKLGDLPSTELE